MGADDDRRRAHSRQRSLIGGRRVQTHASVVPRGRQRRPARRSDGSGARLPPRARGGEARAPGAHARGRAAPKRAARSAASSACARKSATRAARRGSTRSSATSATRGARSPGIPATRVAVIATLGLGIGANTTMFSVIDGVLVKPLPYEGSDRLVLLRQSSLLAGQDDVLLSIPELYGYRERLASDFDGLVEFHQMSFDLIKRGDPNRVAVGVVSANFFDVLRVRPILGRTFQAADAAHGAPAVLLLSNAYWKTRFGGDPTIVGQVFQMNDRPHTVVGVLPPVPIYPQESDVYMPTSACPFRARGEEHMAENWKSFSNLRVFGRLKPGVTIEAASAHVATVAAQFTRDHAEAYRDARGFGASALGLLGELTRNARPMLLILLGRHRAGAAARLRERRQPDAGAHAESRPRARPSHRARRRTPAARRSAAHGKRDARPRRRHRGAAARRHDAGRARHLHRPLHRARRGHRHRRTGARVHGGRLDPDRPGLRRAAGARHAPGAGVGAAAIRRVGGGPRDSRDCSAGSWSRKSPSRSSCSRQRGCS